MKVLKAAVGILSRAIKVLKSNGYKEAKLSTHRLEKLPSMRISPS
jgi:hypothetical protein